MSYFVFLEFASPTVKSFLSDLRQALAPSVRASPVHVTLRGPYKTSPNEDQLKGFAERLRGYGVRVGKHGYFATPNGFSVFLRAECTVFREMWDKPDFPQPLDGIQPHITVFESANRNNAQEVLNFLRAENLLIHTYNVYLRAYQSKSANSQTDLFSPPLIFPSVKPIQRDVWHLPTDVLIRARALGEKLAETSRVVLPTTESNIERRKSPSAGV